MCKKAGALCKKLKSLKMKAAKMCKIVAGCTKRLEEIRKNTALSKDLHREVCMELGRKCMRNENKVEEMEDYYNERIQYYRPMCTIPCKDCITKNNEMENVYKKYVLSLEEINRLKSRVEEAELKKKFYQSKLAEKKT